MFVWICASLDAQEASTNDDLELEAIMMCVGPETWVVLILHTSNTPPFRNPSLRSDRGYDLNDFHLEYEKEGTGLRYTIGGSLSTIPTGRAVISRSLGLESGNGTTCYNYGFLVLPDLEYGPHSGQHWPTSCDLSPLKRTTSGSSTIVKVRTR
ncbi:uncharacterized protein BJ212DRAFT_1294923 [Suillus subaureus]|uniref:Uncharacterized protein n=1 Tax=Suillus subaureus TaxID=48587 RepID=A0A9P7ELI9_9AGAM|nr:uncharacterized protein BJ212DRAFT_1294923 [Suillus subaureus]KAG1825497.1 hypothetical protein BJ212DRAFT_1294923 [Suillus subaureus]